MKKILSILLTAFLLITSLPVNSYATGTTAEVATNNFVATEASSALLNGGKPYEVEINQGERISKFKIPNGNQFNNSNKITQNRIALSRSSLLFVDPSNDIPKFYFKARWNTVDLDFPKEGITVGIEDADFNIIAEGTLKADSLVQEGQTKVGKVELVKTDKFDPNNPDHQNPNKIYVLLPANVELDARIDYSNFTEGEFEYVFRFTQKFQAIFQSKWHDRDSKNRPDDAQVAFYLGSPANDAYYNIPTDENYYSVDSGAYDSYYVNDKDEDGNVIGEIEITRKPGYNGSFSDVTFTKPYKSDDLIGFYYNGEKSGLVPGKNNTNYYLDISGSTTELHRLTMRERLNVTFSAGENGSIEGENPVQYRAYGENASGTRSGAVLTVPTVTENKDYKFSGWKAKEDGVLNDTLLTDETIKTYTFKNNVEFIAQYNNEGDIIPANPGTPVKDGYARVQFNSGEGVLKGIGEDGTEVSDAKVLAYDIKPEITWDKLANTIPKAIPTDKAKLHSNWDPKLEETTSFEKGKTYEYIAQYLAPTAIEKPVYTIGENAPEAKDLIANGDQLDKANFAYKAGSEVDLSENTNGKTAIVEVTDRSGNKVEVSVPYKVIDKVTKVDPVDPTKPFNPDDQDDDNNNRKTDENQVRIIFDAGEGNFGYYNNDITKPIKKVAYDVAKDLSWEDALASGVRVPNVTYTDKAKTFDKWDPAFPATITENKIFTAVSKAKDGEIYKIDDNNPLKDGDVEVQFRKGLHGSFSDTSIGDSVSYGVTPYTGKTLAEVLTELGNAPIKADTGYEFKSWDPAADETQINHAYQLTATYTALDDIRTVETPGYTKVEFKSGDGGSITGNSTFWVNPLKDIMLNAPAVKANVGKTLAGWSANPTTAGEPGVAQKYAQATTYTAKYNDGDKVIIINPGETTPTDRYTVEFVIADEDKDKASFSADSATKFGVLKDATTGINPPSVNLTTGYKLEGWTVNGADYKPSEDHKYTSDVTITAKIGQYDNVIENNGNNEKPAGYLDVSFIVDPNKGTATGATAYFVKPGTAKSEIAVPRVTPKAGYKLQDPAWDKVLPETINESFTANALFIDPADVIPSTGDNKDKPEGYNTVTFESEDTNKGTVTAKETGKLTYWVNGKKPVKFTKDQIPTVSPAKKYVFGAWSINPLEDYVYFKDTTVKALFNNKVDVINGNQEKPDGWVTVSFVLTGENASKASLEGMTSYHVNPKSEGVVLNPPIVKAQTGYALDKWTPDTTVKQKYTTDTSVTGNVIKLPDISKQELPGYTKVTFQAGLNCSLSGDLIMYVNPDASKTFGDINKPVIVPNTGYKVSKQAWINGKGGAIEESTPIGETPITAISNVEKDAGISDTYKEGYIQVTFVADKHSTLEVNGEKVRAKSYWLNPETETTFANVIVPTIVPDTGYTVANQNWEPAFDNKAYVENGKSYTFTSQTAIGGDVSDTEVKGWTKVTFKVDASKATVEGLTADQGFYTKSIWVNPAKGVDISVNAPKLTVNDKYSFVGWKPSIDGERLYKLETIVEAQFTEVDTVIPVPNKDQEERPGYERVIFDTTEKANIAGNRYKAYDVKSGSTWAEAKKKGLAVPTADDITIFNDDYKFAKWNPEIVDTETVTAGTITATFEYAKDIIDVTGKPKEEQENPPQGFIKVTFEKGQGIKSLTPENKVLHVKGNTTLTYDDFPSAELEIGYKDLSWLGNGQNQGFVVSSNNNIFTATATKDSDVIVQPNPETPTPKGYLRVQFIKGQGIETMADIVVDVKEGSTLNQFPEVTLKEGFSDPKWTDKNGGTNYTVTKDNLAFKVDANKGQPVIDVTDNPDQPIKPGYVKVTFKPGEGVQSLKDKTLQVQKNYNLNTSDFAEISEYQEGYQAPAIYPEDRNVGEEQTKIFEIKATKIGDIIDVTNEDEATKNNPKNGFVKVSFLVDDQDQDKAEIKNGGRILHVRSGKQIDLSPYEPVVDIKADYKGKYIHTGWDKGLQGSFAVDTDIYAKLAPITGDISTEPVDGYVKVEYKIKDLDKTKVDLSGSAVYYVNPTAGVNLGKLNPPQVQIKDPNQELDKSTWVDAENNAWDFSRLITEEDKTNGLTYYLNIKPKAIIKIDDPDNPGTKPTENHTLVSFDAVDGKFADNSAKKAYWIEKTKTFKEVIDMLNEVPSKTGSNFIEWQEAGSVINPRETVGASDRNFVASYTSLEQEIEITITQPVSGKRSIKVQTSPAKADVTLFINDREIKTVKTSGSGMAIIGLPDRLNSTDIVKVKAEKFGYKENTVTSGVN